MPLEEVDEVEPESRDHEALQPREGCPTAPLSARSPRNPGRRASTASAASRTRARAARTRSRYTPDAQRRPAQAQRRPPGGQSGRFGVTSDYLVNCRPSCKSRSCPGCEARRRRPAARAQGLPLRSLPSHRATPRRGWASSAPPPHHDIYSIEDIGATHLRPEERRTPEAGVQREARLRSGRRHRGGGRLQGPRRPPFSSRAIRRRNGGFAHHQPSCTRELPWELGLAETQQVLWCSTGCVRQGGGAGGRPDEDGARRGGGRCLLGADEFGFSTAPLVTSWAAS